MPGSPVQLRLCPPPNSLGKNECGSMFRAAAGRKQRRAATALSVVRRGRIGAARRSTLGFERGNVTKSERNRRAARSSPMRAARGSAMANSRPTGQLPRPASGGTRQTCQDGQTAPREKIGAASHAFLVSGARRLRWAPCRGSTNKTSRRTPLDRGRSSIAPSDSPDARREKGGRRPSQLAAPNGRSRTRTHARAGDGKDRPRGRRGTPGSRLIRACALTRAAGVAQSGRVPCGRGSPARGGRTPARRPSAPRRRAPA